MHLAEISKCDNALRRDKLVIWFLEIGKKRGEKEFPMKKKVLAALIIAVGLLAGCGEDELPSPVQVTPQPMNTATPAPEESVSPSQPEEEEPSMDDGMKANGENHPIGQRTVVDGKMQSYLTGEWKDEGVVKRRNMAVMINNLLQALPQYGISEASIIYEAPVEGRITRLMGFFEDYDDLDHIGPVRSSRDYFIFEALAYESIYCNWGLARPWVEELINSDQVDNVSTAVAGINKPASDATYKRIERGSNIAVEHTGYLFIDGYGKDVERLGYDTDYTNRFTQAFSFADEGYIATYESYPDATKIYPGGTQANAGGYGKHNPCFEYNAEERVYYRTQYGQKHIDEMNNEQLSVTNVIFKVCHGEERFPDNDQYDYLAFDVDGTGDAYIFTNGKVIKGTWQRKDERYSPNMFYDENGNEIVLNQGKTWICCIWKEYDEFIHYE